MINSGNKSIQQDEILMKQIYCTHTVVFPGIRAKSRVRLNNMQMQDGSETCFAKGGGGKKDLTNEPKLWKNEHNKIYNQNMMVSSVILGIFHIQVNI